MRLYVEFLSENFMTFSVLFVMTALLAANRKIQIPAARLFPIGIVMIVLLAVTSSVSDHITSGEVTDIAFNNAVLTVLSVFRYILRPCLILLASDNNTGYEA